MIFLLGSPNTEQTSATAPSRQFALVEPKQRFDVVVGAFVLVGVQCPALLVEDLVALATVHAGLAFSTRGLGVWVLVRPAAVAAVATTSASSLINLLEAAADGIEGGAKDGVVVVGDVGGELVRHVGDRLVASNEGGRGAAVESAAVPRHLKGGGEVRYLGVHLVVDGLVDLLGVGGAVVSCGLGTALLQLVQTADLDVRFAEERNEVIENVVCCARMPLFNLVLKILLLLNL